jgi:hypothetical protein
MEENFYKVQYKKENQRKKMACRAVKERGNYCKRS